MNLLATILSPDCVNSTIEIAQHIIQWLYSFLKFNKQINTAETGIILDFNIPFYFGIWFILGVIILIGILLWIIYRLSVLNIQKQKKLLKSLVEERTSELQKMNRSLEEKNAEIKKQSEELLRRQEDMLKVNRILKENEKRIKQQNEELEKHRNNLEELVAERTAELEEAKLNAETSERLKMAFLSNMSHEIRTPMNAIIGFASLLSDNDLTDEEKDEYIKQVNTNGQSLLVLIDDILDLSKIEANQLIIKEEVFDLNSFINEIYNSWAYLDKIVNSTIEFKFTNSLKGKRVIVKYDKQRLKQIIYNLLDNAFKFTPRGSVTLEVTANKEQFIISVKDTGIGISDESIEYIFNRFRKGDDSDSNIYRGAGLGLTICKKLTNMLGGQLWVESVFGKGSKFNLQLPINTTASELVKTEKTDDEGSADDIDFTGRRILIAEDEQNNYLFLKGLLAKRRAEIDWAKTGQEAIDLTDKKHYDMILMDIKMPVMNGIDATKAIKRKKPGVIIIAQTAFARPEEEAAIRKNDFDDYIAKPIKKDTLLKLMNKYLEKLQSVKTKQTKKK